MSRNEGELPAVRPDVDHGAAIEPVKNRRMLHPGRNAVAEHPCPVIWQFENRGKLSYLDQGLHPCPATLSEGMSLPVLAIKHRSITLTSFFAAC